jgi:hypothetical protein
MFYPVYTMSLDAGTQVDKGFICILKMFIILDAGYPDALIYYIKLTLIRDYSLVKLG